MIPAMLYQGSLCKGLFLAWLVTLGWFFFFLFLYLGSHWVCCVSNAMAVSFHPYQRGLFGL